MDLFRCKKKRKKEIPPKHINQKEAVRASTFPNASIFSRSSIFDTWTAFPVTVKRNSSLRRKSTKTSLVTHEEKCSARNLMCFLISVPNARHNHVYARSAQLPTFHAETESFCQKANALHRHRTGSTRCGAVRLTLSSVSSSGR